MRSSEHVRLPLASLPLIAIAGAVAVGAGFALPVHPVIRATVATLVYAGALRAVGRFPPELREVINRSFPSRFGSRPAPRTNSPILPPGFQTILRKIFPWTRCRDARI